MVNAIITPKRHLDVLSKSEIASLQKNDQSPLHDLFRNCALAVLSTGTDSDDGHALLAAHKDFMIEVLSSARGVKVKVTNAPDNAFVDGNIIEGIRNHLFAVLRDIVYLQEQVTVWQANDESLTDMVFKTLRHAKALKPRKRPNLVVCWGGHSISKLEYDYSKEVGYRLGLRGLDICTGCGIGAMKGPMKGAAIAHAKQRVNNARYIGITEPGIIASEAPNAVVNELIIMPDIEKRLEAFVRMGHGIVVFPGGAGTAEEILYILGLLLHPANQANRVPLIFTGPEQSKAYFQELDAFVGETLGPSAQAQYTIVINDPIEVSRLMSRSMRDVTNNRQQHDDAYFFNWSLHISSAFQAAFEPSHENMASLNLSRSQSVENLTADLRRAFSGIVAGNVKPEGIDRIKRYGRYQLRGDTDIVRALDRLLTSFVTQQRMKLSGEYDPCYELSSTS